MATTYDVALYVTQKEYNANGYQSQSVIKDYLYNIFSDISDYYVSVETPDQTPDAPTEAAYNHNEFPVSDYLCSFDETVYDWLSNWFSDWMDCAGNYDADTANLLITNYDGVLGVTVGSYAVTEGGPNISNADPTKRLDKSYESGYVQTALHELGHIFTDPPSYMNEEYMGNNETETDYTGSALVYHTPMITYQDPNDCSHDNEQPSCDDAYVYCHNKQMYSQCVRDHFQ